MSPLMASVTALLSLALTASPDPKLPPVPDSRTSQEAQDSIRMVYEKDLKAAVTQDAKTTLSMRMRTIAAEEKNPVLRYEILNTARTVAVDANNPGLAIDITRDIVSGFASREPWDGPTWIAKGDHLRTLARSLPGRKAQLATRMAAAEHYLRAEPDATGLARELIDKKLKELWIDSVGRRDADIVNLLGRWEIHDRAQVSICDFRYDGTVTTLKASGTWQVFPDHVQVTWSEKSVQRWLRPIHANEIHGISSLRGSQLKGSRIADGK